MPITKKYTRSVIRGMDLTPAQTFQLAGMTSATTDPSVVQVREASAGMAYPSHVSVMSQDAVINCSTRQIATALQYIDALVGLPVGTGLPIVTLEAWHSKISHKAVRDAAGFLETVSDALVTPSRIIANQNAKATLDFEIRPAYNGTADPIVFTPDSAMPTIETTEEYTLGPGDINGIAVEGMMGFTIDFGFLVEVEFVDGQIWPTHVSIMEVFPLITFRTRNVQNLSDFGLSGTPQGATASNLYLTHKKNLNASSDDSDTVHVKFTVNSNQGHISTGPTGGSDRQSEESEIVIAPIEGVAPVLTVDTASAITRI